MVDEGRKKISPTSTTVNANAPDPTIKLPPVVLSGALDKDSLEWDETGAPYYKFPPFVTTTVVTASITPLIPFSAFKPYGLQISLDLDEEEVDGNGIRTVQLGVKHVSKDGKKKKKKSQKLDVTFERRVMWWEDWEEGESLRRGDVSQLNVSRVDRFIQAASDFQKNRRWTPVLQSVYDNFTQFVGLSGKANAQSIGKGFASAKRKAQQEEMELDDDEAEFAAAVKASNATSAASPKPYDPEETHLDKMTIDYDPELESRELRLQEFLDDPDLRMKIFFSSFYKNKGLFWSESKLRDGPLLMRFFFKFITRNGLMRDYDKAFQKALVVVERAVVELPLTTRISKAIPDELGNGCIGLWGKQISDIIEKERLKVVEARESEREPKKKEEEKKDEEKQENEEEEKKKDVSSSEQDPLSNPTPSTTWGDPFSSQASSNPSSWKPFEIPSQWDSTNGENPSSNAEAEFNPWDPMATATADWSLPPPPFLMSMLNGPVSLPLTHEVKLVEKSTRRIVAVEPAANGFGSSSSSSKNQSVFGNFGKITLAPWSSTPVSNPEFHEVSILSPELYIINPSSSPAENDDPTKKTIDAYVSPSSVTILRDAIGIGLYAVLVKVALREPIPAPKKEEEPPALVTTTAASSGGASKKKRKSNKAHSSSSSGQDPDSEFWYIEFLYEVTPSFWTESDEGLDEGSEGDD